MTGATEYLSIMSAILYAAGAALFAAAAAVYIRNNLGEYRSFLKGPSGADALRPLRRAGNRKNTVNDKVKKEMPSKQPANDNADVDTSVHDGNDDTRLLQDTGKKNREQAATPGRIWGKPTGKFKVVADETVTNAGTARGETDETQ